MKDYIRELKVVGVDLDGLLCSGDSFTPEDCLKAKPNEYNIGLVNKLQMTNFVVVYTARRDELIPKTLEWLRRNNVRYQAISNIKTPFDYYWDDRSIDAEGIERMIK